MNSIEHPAERIVSLIPSLTETLFAIGAGARVVGVSNYCTLPAGAVQCLPKVGGPKDPNHEIIESLHPDLLILNSEENRRDDYEWFVTRYPVFVTDVRRLTDVPVLLRDLGHLTGCETKAVELSQQIERALKKTTQQIFLKNSPRVVTLIWHQPVMTVNGDTYLSDCLQVAGAVNVFHDAPIRYPVVTFTRIAEVVPDVVLFPSEPHEWSNAEIEEMMQNLSILGCKAKPVKVDGAAITWYGARTLISLEEFLPDLHQRLTAEVKKND